MLSVHTEILYPVNPCFFVMIHVNELCLITGAPHGVNPSLIELLGVSIHGEDLRTFCCENFYVLIMLGNP